MAQTLPASTAPTVADVEKAIGVPGFLDGLRTSLNDGSFGPLPVRERKIAKPGGAGKLMLEPIFEADFCPSVTDSGRCGGRMTPSPRSSGSAPRGYQWVLDADIEACFDSSRMPS